MAGLRIGSKQSGKMITVRTFGKGCSFRAKERFTISDKSEDASARSAKITELCAKQRKDAFTKRSVALINVARHGFSNP